MNFKINHNLHDILIRLGFSFKLSYIKNMQIGTTNPPVVVCMFEYRHNDDGGFKVTVFENKWVLATSLLNSSPLYDAYDVDDVMAILMKYKLTRSIIREEKIDKILR